MSKKAKERRRAVSQKHAKQRLERERTAFGTAGDSPQASKGELRQQERVNRQLQAKKDNEAYYQSGSEWQTPRR